MNENYTMIKQERLDELDGTGYLLRHNKTGAKVVVISNQDDNKYSRSDLRRRQKMIPEYLISWNILFYADPENSQ